jgi:hypothetical protein
VYTRVTTIFGAKDRVEAGIAHLEGPDRATVEATSGNRGLTTMVDREAAVIIAISYWDELDRSSEADLTRARQDAVAAAGGDLVTESYLLVCADRASVPAPGSTVRLVRAQIAASRGATAVGYLRDEVLPRFRTTAGFQHAEVLVDHAAGAALLVSTWRDKEHAVRADAILDSLHADPLHREHLSFSSTETYTLVRDATDTQVTAGT